MALTNYTTLLSSGSSTKNYPKVYHILSLVGYLLSSSIDEIVSPIEYIYQQLIWLVHYGINIVSLVLNMI